MTDIYIEFTLLKGQQSARTKYTHIRLVYQFNVVT